MAPKLAAAVLDDAALESMVVGVGVDGAVFEMVKLPFAYRRITICHLYPIGGDYARSSR